LGGFYFLKKSNTRIYDYASAKENADTEQYAHFFHVMLEHGVYFAPSQFEAGFMSSAHSDQDINNTIDIFTQVLMDELRPGYK
jgi:glutamate-1-semialdehyde 2,1-aminomutase